MDRDDIDLGQNSGLDLSGWLAPDFPIAKRMDGQFCRVEPLHVKSHIDGLWAANSEDKDGLMWRNLPNGPFEDKNTQHTCFLSLSGATIFLIVASEYVYETH